MKDKKTDESVKAGLQIEAGKHPQKKRTAPGNYDNTEEIDADDAMHRQMNKSPMDNEAHEQDADDVVHSTIIDNSSMDDDEPDAEDLLYQK